MAQRSGGHKTSPGFKDSVISEVNEVTLGVRPMDAEGCWSPTDPGCGEEGGHKMGCVSPSKTPLVYRQTSRWICTHIYRSAFQNPPDWTVKHWDDAMIV